MDEEGVKKPAVGYPVPQSSGDAGVGHMLNRNTENCPKCGATPNTFYVANYSMIWHDGDVMCRCGHRVRTYDAG